MPALQSFHSRDRNSLLGIGNNFHQAKVFPGAGGLISHAPLPESGFNLRGCCVGNVAAAQRIHAGRVDKHYGELVGHFWVEQKNGSGNARGDLPPPPWTASGRREPLKRRRARHTSDDSPRKKAALAGVSDFFCLRWFYKLLPKQPVMRVETVAAGTIYCYLSRVVN